MSSSAIRGLCILFFLIGSVVASDIPWVFNKSLDISNYTSNQIENISKQTPQITGVPPIYISLNNGTVKNVSEINKSNYLLPPDFSIKESINNGQDWFITGNYYYDAGNYNKSIECYEMATQENPQFAEAWYNKGNALYKLGMYEKAINAFKYAIRINPGYTKAKKNLQTIEQDINMIS